MIARGESGRVPGGWLLQHVIDSLKSSGRCGIVLDEGVLFRTNETKVGKKTPLTLAHFEEFFRLLPDRADGPHSWMVTREAIEAKGREVSEAVAALRPVSSRRLQNTRVDDRV